MDVLVSRWKKNQFFLKFWRILSLSNSVFLKNIWFIQLVKFFYVNLCNFGLRKRNYTSAKHRTNYWTLLTYLPIFFSHIIKFSSTLYTFYNYVVYWHKHKSSESQKTNNMWPISNFCKTWVKPITTHMSCQNINPHSKPDTESMFGYQIKSHVLEMCIQY